MLSFKNLKSDVVYGLLALAVMAAGVTAALLFRDTLTGRSTDQASDRDRASVPVEAAVSSLRFVPAAQAQRVADVAFVDESGTSRKLSDWRGKVVLVNLWAMWCAPCKLEMPALDRLQAAVGGERFAVLALNTDRAGLKDARRFFEKSGLHRLALVGDDTAESNKILKAEGLPTSVILDADGREVARILGPLDWDKPEIVSQLKAYVAP